MATSQPDWRPVVVAVEQVQRQLDVLSVTAADAVQRTAPSYERVSRRVLESTLSRNLQVLLVAHRDRRLPDPSQLAALAAPAEQRAREGISLDDVLTAYSEAMRLSAEWVDEGLAAAEVHLLLELASLRLSTIGAVYRAAATAHRRGDLSRDREMQQRRTDSVQRILRGELPAEELRQAIELLGLASDTHLHVVRARIGDLPAEQVQREISDGHDGSVLVVNGADVIGFVAREPTRRDVAWTAGISRPRTVEDAALGWAEATRIVDVAVKYGRTGPIAARHIGLRLVVPGDDLFTDVLVAKYVTPLRQAKGLSAELLHTVQIYLEKGSRRDEAAKHLHLHPTTVSYRITRFCDLTEANLLDLETLVELWWVFRLVDLDPGLLS